jgi:hypothetical protein
MVVNASEPHIAAIQAGSKYHNATSKTSFSNAPFGMICLAGILRITDL